MNLQSLREIRISYQLSDQEFTLLFELCALGGQGYVPLLADFLNKSECQIYRILGQLLKKGLIKKDKNCYCLANLQQYNNQQEVLQEQDLQNNLKGKQAILQNHVTPQITELAQMINEIIPADIEQHQLLLIQELGINPDRDLAIEAATYSLKQYNNPYSRIQQGLKPVENLMGYYRIILRKMAKNMFIKKDIQELNQVDQHESNQRADQHESSLFNKVLLRLRKKTLLPAEIELIKQWNNSFSSEQILSAIDKAVLAGKTMFSYINAILNKELKNNNKYDLVW